VDLKQCNECGFSGEEWSDGAAVSAISGLPTGFADAVAGASVMTIYSGAEWMGNHRSLNMQTMYGSKSAYSASAETITCAPLVNW
jgi:hypothetical protein